MKCRYTASALSVGGLSIPLDENRRPKFSGEVIVGVRPEAFEDIAFAESGLATIDVVVEVLEELGSDAHLFFAIEGSEPIVIEEARADDPEDNDGTLLADSDRGLFAARVDARTKAKAGERITLAIDPSRLYFFSPDTGETLLTQRAA